MSDARDVGASLPDGVYLGFNLPGVNGKSIPHPWVEVLKGGDSRTYEYGPSGDRAFGIGSPMIEMNAMYADNANNAGALFRLQPPSGITPEQFIDRATAAGHALDNALKRYIEVPYVPVLGADCDTAALSLLHNLGGSALQFEQMTASAVAGSLQKRGFADAGGLSVAMTAGAVAESYILTSKVWEKVGPAPGIAFPGLGSLDYRQLEHDSHGQWVEMKELRSFPTRRPGIAPKTDDFGLAAASAQTRAEPALQNARAKHAPEAPLIIHIERDGLKCAIPPGYSQQGRIVACEDDRIVQDVGRGRQASYSRKELEAHFGDKTAFDAMMQPGNYVKISTSRRGVVDAQQDIPGHGWHSLSNQPLSPSHSQSVGRSIGS